MITTSSLLKLAPRGSYFLMNAWSTLMSVEWKINTIGTHLWTKSVFIWKLQNFAMLGAGPLSDSQQWIQASVCFHMATWAPSKSSELFPSGRAQKEYSSFFQKAVQVFFRCKATCRGFCCPCLHTTCLHGPCDHVFAEKHPFSMYQHCLLLLLSWLCEPTQVQNTNVVFFFLTQVFP